MTDLFNDPDLVAYWEAREFKKYVVRLGHYKRGCWITSGRMSAKPTHCETFYVRARDERGAGRAALRAAQIASRYPWPANGKNVFADQVRYLGPQDFESSGPWSITRTEG